MFGTLRLILASLVVMSHTEIYPKIPGFYWFSQGAMALVGFFLLSGYLMKMIFLKRYENKLIHIGTFWYDRWLRIFPHYYFYLIIITFWIIITKFSQLNWQLLPVISHIFVLPLNLINLMQLQMLSGWPYWALIIPQAWTLALEFQFYLLLPFLLKSKWIEILAFIISLLIFLLSAIGILSTEAYGYRLLPGILFIFISGGLLYDLRLTRDNKLNRFLLLFSWMGMIVLAVLLAKNGKLSVPLNAPVIFGYLLFVPVIYLLSAIKVRRKWDDWMGNLSYGVFLNHYWLIWVLDWLKVYPQPTMHEKWIRFILVMLVSIAFSYISYLLIDNNMKKIRIQFR